jgi:hypothetical protein
MCKHATGFDERFCSLCLETQGILTGTARVKAEKVSLRAAEKEWEKTLDQIIQTSDNFGEDWSYDECKVLYDLFDGQRPTKKLVVEAAKTLQRTRKSVIWHYKHMFIIPNSSKAGETLLSFKRDMGLLKEAA